ncbi:Hypothetical protein NTJ_00480 [Nesidiocoris tenuis]|uniref:Uncharacterized protein n=1 Tax=Nesidiocoris tenuis TaxID=355587 RepID=A0ABN7A9Z2_9HEMI|nr:Hypothetical protein NTJ_00480 [Nesidiocoris tenuis]
MGGEQGASWCSGGRKATRAELGIESEQASLRESLYSHLKSNERLTRNATGLGHSAGYAALSGPAGFDQLSPADGEAAAGRGDRGSEFRREGSQRAGRVPHNRPIAPKPAR